MQYLKTKLKGILLIGLVMIMISQTIEIEGKEIEEKETSNDMPEVIYETDYITIELEKYPLYSADLHEGQIRLNADGEAVGFTTYLDEKIDPNEKVILTCVFYRVDNNNDTLDIYEGIWSYMTDGTLDSSTIKNAQTTWDACATDKWEKQQITISSGIEAGKLLKGYFQMKEAGREIKIETISIRYHIKRVVS